MASSILTTTPVNTTGNDPAPIAWVARFRSVTPGHITGIRYYVGNALLTDGRITSAFARVFDSSGGVDDLAYEIDAIDITAALAGGSTGWRTFSFITPIAMEANHTYGISIDFVTASANVRYGFTSSFAVPVVNENLTLEMVGFRDGSGHAGYPAGPTGTVNFFVDPVVDAPAPVTVSVGADRGGLAAIAEDIEATAVGSGTLTYAWSKTSGPFGSFGDTSDASTTFTPEGGDGIYVLRCTVTDDYTSSYDEFTLTVVEPELHATPTATVTASGWTFVGGADESVLGDDDIATYAQSSINPVAQVLTVEMDTLDEPGVGKDLSLRIVAGCTEAGTGTLVAKLYEGSTLRGTADPYDLEPGLNSIEMSFAYAITTEITDWSNLRVRLEVTAS